MRDQILCGTNAKQSNWRKEKIEVTVSLPLHPDFSTHSKSSVQDYRTNTTKTVDKNTKTLQQKKK